jgi:hypothetical protein
MSSDTDHPRQRTVAELLAEHGAAAGVTGRRRRRREAESGDEEAALEQTNGRTNGAAPPSSEWPAAAPPGTDRHIRRDDSPGEPLPRRHSVNGTGLAPEPEPEPTGRRRADRRIEAELPPSPVLDSDPLDLSPPPVVRERPTDQMPRIRDEPPGPPPSPPAAESGRTGPIAPHRPEPPPPPPVHEPDLEPWYEEDDEFDEDEFVARDYSADGAPGNAPVAHDEYGDGGDYHDDEDRYDDQYDEDDYDDDYEEYDEDEHDEHDREAGPPTMIGAAPVGAEQWHEERTRRLRRDDAGGPATQATQAVGFADRPAGFGPDDDFPDEIDDEVLARRRAQSAERPAGQAWAVVIGQWIVGAIGGAALWVGFRFLWRSLPVVALAAAVLVTVGLVIVVRALLRNDDMRTTLLAVLVGLLLTVSPAILVLLGR